MSDDYCRVLTCGNTVRFGATICFPCAVECAVEICGGTDEVGDSHKENRHG